jgi:hypothetical protein
LKYKSCAIAKSDFARPFSISRLKNKLLLKIPELKPFHKGREVFEKDVGPALVFACDYTDASRVFTCVLVPFCDC